MENQDWVLGEPPAKTEPTAAAPVAGEPSAAVAQARLVREIRSWGRWLLLLGVIHLIASGFLNPGWGVMLIVLGLASFYFREPAMLVLYAVTLAWAAVSNLTSGGVGWIVFALFQVYMVYSVLRSFFRFRTATADYAASIAGLAPASFGGSGPAEERAARRAARLFPWAGLAISVLALVGMVGVWAAVIIVAVSTAEGQAPNWLGWVADMDINLAVLALGLSIASLLARYRHKGLSIVATVISALVTAAWLVIALVL